MINYFDSSILLTILMNEPRTEEALAIWRNNNVRVSSILLRFETNIVLRRNYRDIANKVNSEWLATRLQDLNKFLNDVFYRDINEFFEYSVHSNYDMLSKCKSLDAIHIATVLDISKKHGKNEIQVCSFDKNMLAVAKELGFVTNPINP
ncbi:MAG: PIN domain-containing protein [Fibromonadales bacterium]|nr:PIN domain-containing protein [Fibromonadales bacterium]